MFRASAYDRRYGTDPLPINGAEGDVQPIAHGIPGDAEKGVAAEHPIQGPGPFAAANSTTPQYA